MNILLKNATVIDGVSEKQLNNYSILIEGKSIKKMAPAKEMIKFERQENIKVIDCDGKTLMPGLIDAHTHLIYRNFSDAMSIELNKSLEEATIDALLTARELINYGVTTVREVGTRGNISVIVRDAIKRGEFPGPEVYASSRIISTEGGLADFHPTHMYNQYPVEYGLGELILGVDEARRAVRKMLKDGVDWIKVECSGTGANPLCPAERNTLSYEEVTAVVEEARQNGVYVACHAESNASVKKASKAGVRTIEHGIYLDEEAIELMLMKNIYLVPTLGMYWAFVKNGAQVGIPDAVIEGHKRTHEHHVRSIHMAMEAGVPIVAGSDAGMAHFPQGGVREEIESFVQIGMDKMEAVKTATSNAARCLNIEDKVGSLEEGKQADILILNENPLDDISLIKKEENVMSVIKEGEVLFTKLNENLVGVK